LVFLGLAALGAVAALAKDSSGQQDACVQRGGLWFGEVGCETDMRGIDRVVVDKSQRTLWAYRDGKPVRAFQVALGSEPVGHKERQGDGKTPEGVYPVVAHKENSDFHRALRLGYPTPEQAAAAEEAGFDPGGDIMIHGLPNGMGAIGRAHRQSDWTQGCIALTNVEIEWLYRFGGDGMPVEIRP
jgi:murein L,D-transpeptidase YafK